MYGFVGAVLSEKGRQVHSVNGDATVRAAVRAMNEAGIGALLVMKQDDVAGMFTERDVLRRVVDAGRDPNTTRVREVMTHDLVVVAPSTRIEEAMALMTEHRCRHLPVMDNGVLVGMVSIGDMNRWVSMNLESDLQRLTEYITGPVG